jgi:hypothetical protein
MVRSKFDPQGKNIIFKDKIYPLTINGKLIFGPDGPMPKTYLSKAVLQIGAQAIQLQVDDMYDPWISGPCESEFKFISTDYGNLLKGYFSDGAGSYVAEWMIKFNSSIRTILKYGEDGIIHKYFDEQYNK